MHLSALEQKHEEKNKKRTVLRSFTPGIARRWARLGSFAGALIDSLSKEKRM